MPKTIIRYIHSCDDCPAFLWSSSRCSRTDPSRAVADPDEIPEWCPLPDTEPPREKEEK